MKALVSQQKQFSDTWYIMS